jgi:pyruvate dehydrogenase E1 component
MTDSQKIRDLDPQETQEWLESIESVIRVHGAERAHYIIERMVDETRRAGIHLPFSPNTAYVNTIGAAREAVYPGDRSVEKRIEAFIRWNAMAMVLNANKESSE